MDFAPLIGLWIVILGGIPLVIHLNDRRKIKAQVLKDFLAERKRCDLGNRIYSVELDPKKINYSIDVPGFVSISGLDAWYCSMDNIHKRCASLILVVNTSRYEIFDRPFFPTKRITVNCIDGDGYLDENLHKYYIGSFNSRHYYIANEETL